MAFATSANYEYADEWPEEVATPLDFFILMSHEAEYLAGEFPAPEAFVVAHEQWGPDPERPIGSVWRLAPA